MLKRVWLFLLIPLLLCSCTKNKVEEITFSSWGSITEVGILNKLISDFEHKNPDIKINFIHIPQNYFQKIHLLFASSTAPDVIFINNLYMPIYENKLEDLSEIINKDEFFPESIDALSINNKLLAVPRDISNFVLYYNKNYINDDFKKGLSFKNFESLIKKNTTGNRFGVSFERDVFIAEPYLMTLGRDKGLDFYKDLEGKYAPKPSDVGSSTLAQMFLDGKIAFYQSGRWMYPKISDSAEFDFGVVKFPGYTPADASGWAISADSKHKESALKFIKFLSSEESIEYFTKTGLIVPARKNASKLLNNSKERAFLDAIKNSKSHHVDKNYAKQRDRLNKELFR